MKLALFGGTFDPPHLGHLQMAEAAVEECGLEKVIFLPAQQSPHKSAQPLASGAERLEMLRLATAERPWAVVSDWEILRPGPSYSWQTAAHFAAEHPAAELHWLLGEDQWRTLGSWAQPQRLAALLTFIVVPRSGLPPQPQVGFRAHFLRGEFAGRATRIRQQLAHGEAADGLPAGVAEFIAARELYH